MLVTLSTFKDSLSSEYISTLVPPSGGAKSFRFWFGFIHFTETEPCFSKVTFSILAFFQSVNHVLKAHQTILLCPQAYFSTNFEIALEVLPVLRFKGIFFDFTNIKDKYVYYCIEISKSGTYHLKIISIQKV